MRPSQEKGRGRSKFPFFHHKIMRSVYFTLKIIRSCKPFTRHSGLNGGLVGRAGPVMREFAQAWPERDVGPHSPEVIPQSPTNSELSKFLHPPTNLLPKPPMSSRRASRPHLPPPPSHIP